jgi:peptide/nickel transport system permease protein
VTAYIIRRVLYGIPIILGTLLLLFVIFNVLPGQDPALQLAGRHATPETLASIRHELGLDQSLPMQFVHLLKQTVTFDFGRSWSTKQQISDMIVQGAPASLSLTVPPFIASIVLSLLIGMLVAMYRGTWLDKSIIVLCVAGQSISLLVYILFGQYFLAYKWGLFPISGYTDDWAGRWQYIVLPGIIYIVLALAPSIRFYRTVILDEFFQDYVRTARSKGLSGRAVMLKHVLKNAMIPVITDLVIQIPFLILGLLLLETFFGIPGLGDLTIRAIANNDRPVLIAVTVMGTMAFVVFDIVSDVLYALVDPRVQLK